MAALQRVPQPTVTTAVSSCAPSCSTGIGPSSVVGGEKETASDQFPVGLRVLVVDDDVTCLRIVEQMLRQCRYHVTTCSKATVALQLLREKKNYFDVVLSDVHMPDIDGYKLLELIGLEMDLPVIMMSADGTTSAVMKGIRHGACDYLIKPIRAEELKNLWQHVVRKKCNGNKEFEPAGNFDDNDWHRRSNDDIEYASSVNEDAEGLKGPKKRSNSSSNNNNNNTNNNNNNYNYKEEDESEPDNDDPSSSKKPRVVWSVELHQQFVSAVNQLGLDKAVPKRILELMNVPGLTRENVASHLQKFRLYLKRLSVGGLQLQSGFSNTFCGSMEPNVKLGGSVGRFDIQSLAASGQIPPQTLAVLHSEFLGRPAGNLGPTMDPPALLHASILGPKPVEHDLVFSPGPVKCQPNIFKQFGTPFISVEDASRYGPWTGNNVRPSNPNGGFGAQNNNLLMDMLHQQKQLQQPQQKQAMVPEPSRSINVQPSCLVVPSQSSTSFNACSPPVNQNCSFNRSPVVDYNTMLLPQSNIPALNGVSNGVNKTTGSLCGPFSAPGSTSILTSSLNGENNACVPNLVNARLQNPTLSVNACVPNLVGIQGSFGANPSEMLDQGPLRNLGYVSKGTFVPSRYALDEYESPMRNLTHQKLRSDNSTIPVKQEPNTEFMDNGSLVLPQFPSSDLMSVFTK